MLYIYISYIVLSILFLFYLVNIFLIFSSWLYIYIYIMNTCYFEYVLFWIRVVYNEIACCCWSKTRHHPPTKEKKNSFFLSLFFWPIHTNPIQSNPINWLSYSFIFINLNSLKAQRLYIYYLVKWKTNLVHPYPHPSNIPIYYYYRIISVVKCYLFLFLPRFSYCSISHYFPPN